MKTHEKTIKTNHKNANMKNNENMQADRQETRNKIQQRN